ncbi:MAG: hypothetical protein OEY14_03740, partial [Myxococcales bacterium]|nr:hypothetical protein [Myxococcales bacterium]
ARSHLDRGTAALSRNDIDAAISALREAQRIVGRRHGSTRTLRSSLGGRASNKVGILMQQGRCPQAQQLYRSLRGVGAEAPSRSHFSGDWCPRP